MSEREIDSILVTGGTGFFGRAFCRYVLEHELAQRVCILSRGEHAQDQMRRDFQDDDRLRWFVGDVRDLDRLTRAMRGVDLVVHAAALKRIEVGRYCPDEMVKTNVVGALNIVSAAERVGVAKVVALSTDKACQPQAGSAYGQTKALMETILLASNDTVGADGPSFAVCRYGNIFGSTGSILPTWMNMIERGCAEVPLSNPDVTRFFMLVGEAVDLVISTAAHMKPGKNFAIPDLPAYRLGDLAEALNVKTRITGLKPFEKMHEMMREDSTSEHARRMTVEELRHHIQNYRNGNEPYR